MYAVDVVLQPEHGALGDRARRSPDGVGHEVDDLVVVVGVDRVELEVVPAHILVALQAQHLLDGGGVGIEVVVDHDVALDAELVRERIEEQLLRRPRTFRHRVPGQPVEHEVLGRGRLPIDRLRDFERDVVEPRLSRHAEHARHLDVARSFREPERDVLFPHNREPMTGRVRLSETRISWKRWCSSSKNVRRKLQCAYCSAVRHVDVVGLNPAAQVDVRRVANLDLLREPIETQRVGVGLEEPRALAVLDHLFVDAVARREGVLGPAEVFDAPAAGDAVAPDVLERSVDEQVGVVSTLLLAARRHQRRHRRHAHNAAYRGNPHHAPPHFLANSSDHSSSR